MQIHHIGKEHSILNRFIYEIRSVSIQNDRMRFRNNLERIGEILAYELSKSLAYTTSQVQTPLNSCDMSLPQTDIVLCTILRAGLPLQQGIQRYFDHADLSFISAYRKHQSETKFDIAVEYMASSSLEGKTLILSDPMLATGQSMVACYKALLQLGTPSQTHFVSVIGAEAGVNHLQQQLPKNSHLWIAAIDQTLNEKGYIVPGLGDAGDLAFGSKLQH
ncbi:MAG: uracil phosphoribosyltransferase [Flavobacteriaceae bacterium]|nr:uracil phosphoribosyltransferase [Flavobacteriaceae bacterium]